ncbi:hypothetical protein IPH67_01575 [bacterium]|nr:MAG: hypothetical protein IPH67_01575 [bacterium]
MLLHKKAICLSIVFLLSVQKYAYVSAMEMVKGDDAAVENKLNEIGQQYGTVQSFLSTAITSWQADRLDVSRVNLIKTLFESHIKNFPFRPFMGYAEDYPSLRFVILNKHSNMKIQQLTDERFYDCINSYFAAQLFSSQGFWTNNSKFEDIFNRNYQVFNEQAPLNVPDAPRQIDVAGNVQGKDNRPPDPQGNFKKLYFRFQEVYQEELAKLLYERQKTGLQAKPIDKECIKGLLVPPTQGGNEALFLINSITEYGVKIASNYRLEKAFLTILAQKEVNIILENVQKVINLFDQKSSEFEKVITEYMPEKGSRNNVTTLLTNDKPELIYHYIKEGNLRGELNATRIKRLRDRKPEWEETAKKDPCQCLSDINATLSNKGSLLKSIEYLNEVAGIIDTIIWPTLWFVGCVTNNLNFVQWMLQECNELKDHLENTFNVLMRDIDQKRKTGFYTNGMYSHWQQDKEKSIRSLLKFNFQKANLLTFMIQAEEKSQLRYIWFLLKKLATKSEATNKSENEDSDLDKN